MKNQKPLSSSIRRFLYIISQEKNKKKIDKFREKWGIPSKGFADKGIYNLWLHTTIACPPIKLKRVILKTKITDYAITENQIIRGKTEELSRITDIKASLQELFNDNFQKAIDELGADMGMDNNWTGKFGKYLLKGNKALINHNEASLDILKTTKYYEEGKHIIESLIMIIEPNTTKEEVISAWERFIEKEKKSMKGFIDVPSGLKIKKPD